MTGTGKTFTMVGDYKHDQNKGIIPRALEQIFDREAEDEGEYSYNVEVGFIQIYLEMI